MTLDRSSGGPRSDLTRSEAILGSIRQRIAMLGLDLSGMTVVTEAATGAYAVTAVIAAMAGAAHVHAIGRDSRHGSFDQAAAETLQLALLAGVADRINIARRPSRTALKGCDILTNSGHLRPITRDIVRFLRPGSVIALMFEAWEFREADLDIGSCRARGVRVAAVNERHPDVGVFDFLGPLCEKLLSQGGVPIQGSRIALICDNPFESFIADGLRRAGAVVRTVTRAEEVPPGGWDTVVVALNPETNESLGSSAFSALAAAAPGAMIAQFWGDMDRAAARRHGFDRICPPVEPSKGHMAVLLDALGHEPIVRLQCGGLKAAELAWRGAPSSENGVLQLL